MAFYDLSKEERAALTADMHARLSRDLKRQRSETLLEFFSDDDTYIRKTAYIAVGRIYKANPDLHKNITEQLSSLFLHENPKIRQTVINTAGEIGIFDFTVAAPFMHKGLFDAHHSVRNAVIGSIKKMGEKNPKPTLAFAKQYLQHPEKEIRREICHGIELRGRTHPQDILPLLKTLQFDPTARVRKTLVHVLGQIAYKKGCLETVIAELKGWDNQELVKEALEEIIDVHYRYRNFSVKTQEEAIRYIEKNLNT